MKTLLATACFSLLLLLPHSSSAFSLYEMKVELEDTAEQITADPVSEPVEADAEALHAAPVDIDRIRDRTKSGIYRMREAGRLSNSVCNELTEAEMKDYCKKQYLIQKLTVLEKKHIENRRSRWNLTDDYCFHRTTYENHLYCQELLRDQQSQCEVQKTNGNRLIIDLESQYLYALKDCELKVFTRITTGKNSTPTPTGTYQVYLERGEHWMQGQWFVNKALYFRGGYAVHDAGWRISPFWKPEKRAVHGSHGCVNLPREAMEIVWEHFGKGDYVQIYHTLPADVRDELTEKVGDLLPVDPERI